MMDVCKRQGCFAADDRGGFLNEFKARLSSESLDDYSEVRDSRIKSTL